MGHLMEVAMRPLPVYRDFTLTNQGFTFGISLHETGNGPGFGGAETADGLCLQTPGLNTWLAGNNVVRTVASEFVPATDGSGVHRLRSSQDDLMSLLWIPEDGKKGLGLSPVGSSVRYQRVGSKGLLIVLIGPNDVLDVTVGEKSYKITHDPGLDWQRRLVLTDGDDELLPALI